MKVYVLMMKLQIGGSVVDGVTADAGEARKWCGESPYNSFLAHELADFSPAAYLSKRGASKGGKARQAGMTPAERSAHGRKMIAARWGKSKKSSG